jgi:ElaB/YqjD/DUF883 family membrane-anchored ribosome-binding protein
MPSINLLNNNEETKEHKELPSQNLDSAPIRRNISRVVDLTKSIAARAKASSSIVKYGLDQIEWISQPVVDKVVAFGDPLLAKVDNGINSAYGALFSESPKAATFLDSKWFHKVDEIIGFQFFYNAAKTQYLLLSKKGDPVQREDFGASLKKTLQHVWDDSLGVVADAFWEKAKSIEGKDSAEGLKRINSGTWLEFKLQFQEVWGSQIVGTFQARVISPAASLYAVALDHYLSFDLAQRRVSAQEFVLGMKTRLGNSWNENLEKPLREFLVSAQTAAIGELRRLHRALDSNKDGIVTIGDVIDVGQKVVGPVVDLTTGLVTGTWRGFLQVSQNTFDFIVPSGSESYNPPLLDEDQKAPITLKSVQNRVSRRLKAKAFAGFGRVRKFSAERLKDIIHIDLIAYAEEVIDNSKNSAKPTYDQVQAKLNVALLSIRSTLNEATVASKDFLEVAMKRTKLDQIGERTKPVASLLKVKLQEAIDRAKDLSAYGKDYLIYHQELSTLPMDTAQFILHVPYLLSSRPKPGSGSSDFSVVKTKIENLLSAIRDTFTCLILLDRTSVSTKSGQLVVTEESNGKGDIGDRKGDTGDRKGDPVESVDKKEARVEESAQVGAEGEGAEGEEESAEGEEEGAEEEEEVEEETEQGKEQEE